MTITHKNHTYEIVDSIPYGYEIWNIGHHAPPGYLPLCKPIEPGSYTIDPNTLKAIKFDGAEIILDAIGTGPSNVKEMEHYIKMHHNARPGTYEYHAICRMQRALPYMKQLTWK